MLPNRAHSARPKLQLAANAPKSLIHLFLLFSLLNYCPMRTQTMRRATLTVHRMWQ